MLDFAYATVIGAGTSEPTTWLDDGVLKAAAISAPRDRRRTPKLSAAQAQRLMRDIESEDATLRGNPSPS